MLRSVTSDAKDTVETSFAVGEKVKYWSATVGKWISAQVQRINWGPKGYILSYDLDAKPQACTTKIRNSSTLPDAPPPGSGDVDLGFAIDRHVKYWSEKHSAWVDARVKGVNRGPEGNIASYDLDAKALADPTRIRDGSTPADAPPHTGVAQNATSTPMIPGTIKPRLDLDVLKRPAGANSHHRQHRTSFQIGDLVEYWSESKGAWVNGVVNHISTSKDRGVVYDLDVKKGTSTDRLRHRSHPKYKAPAVLAERQYAAGKPEAFAIGEHVEYWSETKQKWLSTIVLAAKTCGKKGGITYELTCKQEAPARLVRAQSSFESFQIGDKVEFWSTSSERWLEAKVLRLHPNLRQCDLDVKVGASLRRIRRPVKPFSTEHEHDETEEIPQLQAQRQRLEESAKYTYKRQAPATPTTVPSPPSPTYAAVPSLPFPTAPPLEQAEDVLQPAPEQEKVHVRKRKNSEIQGHEHTRDFEKGLRGEDEAVKERVVEVHSPQEILKGATHHQDHLGQEEDEHNDKDAAEARPKEICVQQSNEGLQAGVVEHYWQMKDNPEIQKALRQTIPGLDAYLESHPHPPQQTTPQHDERTGTTKRDERPRFTLEADDNDPLAKFFAEDGVEDASSRPPPGHPSTSPVPCRVRLTPRIRLTPRAALGASKSRSRSRRRTMGMSTTEKLDTSRTHLRTRDG